MGGLTTSLAGSSLASEKSSSREVVTTSPSPSADSMATTSSLKTGSTVKPNSSATIAPVAVGFDLHGYRGRFERRTRSFDCSRRQRRGSVSRQSSLLEKVHQLLLTD